MDFVDRHTLILIDLIILGDKRMDMIYPFKKRPGIIFTWKHIIFKKAYIRAYILNDELRLSSRK